MPKFRSLAILVCVASLCVSVSATASPPPAKRAAGATFEAEISRLATSSGISVGAVAWRLDGRGVKLLFNANDSFPMASTYKVAIAGRIMQRVDKAELRLDQMIEIRPEMMVPSEVLAESFIHPGVSISLYNLLELMLTYSDNTATDVLMATAGGAGAVDEWLKHQGIIGMRVDRNTAELLSEFYKLPAGTPMEAWNAALAARPNLQDQDYLPSPSFDNDPKDTTTPLAMGTLLTRIFSGQALSSASTSVISDIMMRCHTGDRRLRGMLPKGTMVAHKTGSLGGTINDVGVMKLPGSAGQVVIVVYTKKSAAPLADRERIIAEIARTAYDYFLLTASDL